MKNHRAIHVLIAAALHHPPAPPGTAEEERRRDAFWQPVDGEAPTPANGVQRVHPRHYEVFRLDRARTAAYLAEAPLATDEGPTGGRGGALISLPLPDGSVVPFLAREDPILDPAAQQANPDVRTYVVTRQDDPSVWGRLTWTTTGLHAILFLPGQTAFIAPLWSTDATVHAAWYLKDAEIPDTPFICETVTHIRDEQGALRDPHIVNPGIGGTQHTFTIAVQTTPSYSSWATGAGGFASITAAVTDSINRVNAVYQRNLAIRLVLTIDTDLFYTTAAPPAYAEGDLTGIHNDITAEVGSANFDVGISLSGIGGSGVSSGRVCTDSTKARLYASASTPADALFLFITCHEMGHHFDAGHSWSSDTFAASQFDPNASWEPGAGSTIMSYAGLDSAYPVGNGIPGVAQGDLYFHGGSVDEIRAFVSGLTCDTENSTGNAPPVANAGSDYTIPKQTPFKLTGTGSDTDDAAANLTYAWEGLNPTANQLDIDDLDDGTIPLFRSFPPAAGTGGSFMRYFPELQVLIDDDQFPGTTTPGIVGQQLPRVSRTLAYWLTVRDNRTPSATVVAGLHQDAMSLTVDDTTGPFEVTSPNGGESWDVANTQTVTWNVAGTTGGAVNAANVNIRLSIDGGSTYPFLLVGSTPNDGTQSVSLTCDMRTTQARVLVEAEGNVFFDISDDDFEIVDNTPPVVTCSVTRRFLWPARGALFNPGFTYSAIDSCDPLASLTFQITVRSDEAHGPPPFTPDAYLLGGTYLLRADRNIRLNGRVYLFLVEATDTSGNIGFECCTAIVPRIPTVSWITAALMQATNARNECLANSGATPTWAPQQLHP